MAAPESVSSHQPIMSSTPAPQLGTRPSMSPESDPDHPLDTLSELHRIWESATADSISRDLDRATALAERVPDPEREVAERYLAALWRLERWLHDR